MDNPNPFPRLVILTGDEGNLPARRLVLALAAAGLPLAGVVIDPLRRRRPASEPTMRQRYTIFLKNSMWRYAAHKFLGGLRRRWASRLRLEPPYLPELCAQRGIATAHVENVNEPAGLAALEALEPEVLVMMGCRILKAPVLAAARLAINFHTGILPWYRGSDTIYWAMRNGEPDRVGYSIHEGVEALDAGQVFFEEAVRPRPGELIEQIWTRCVERATPHWIELLREYQREGALHGRMLDLSEGHVYKNADWWAHATLESAWLRGKRE